MTELRCLTSLTSLPERLGELQTLQTLNLQGCSSGTLLSRLRY